MRKLTKALHEIGAIGVMGALAACLVLGMTAPANALPEFAAVRHSIVMVHKYLYVPALALSLVSGLIAIAATNAYKDAGWAWMKALTGVSLFEGSLLTIVGPAKRAAALSAQALTGAGDPAALAQALHSERSGMWVMLALSTANVVLGVWRPRFGRRAGRLDPSP
jgi:hypothetical protein